MACFIVPAGEAIVTTVVQKVMGKKGKKSGTLSVKWSQRLGWLNKMLWGGSIMLAFEHLWHGEIVPWPPFLTAINNPADVTPMLREMATVGVAMALTVTAIWAIMILVAELNSRAASRIKTTHVNEAG